MSDPPGPCKRWVLAARPRTLPAAIVPVAVGAVAVHPASLSVVRTGACAIIALGLQVGTNYANDYADGVRGTDDRRVGPFRITASGLVGPATVKFAAGLSFLFAAAVGLALAAATSWWLVLVGAGALAAGWFYTGGKHPYGYLGLGEVAVMIFFGFVAVIGTSYVQDLTVPGRSWWLAAAVGAAACVLLEANNLRDIDTDRAAGKHTLAARLGRRRAALLVLGFVGLVVIGSGFGAAWYDGLFALVVYTPALAWAFSTRSGRDLLGLLGRAARAQLLLGVALVVTCAVVS